MLQFAKNTYLPNLNNIHLLWETNFVSLGTQRLNLNLSLCSAYLENNATLADSPDRLVEHCTPKQEVMSSMGPLHEAVTWYKKHLAVRQTMPWYLEKKEY